MRWDKNFLGRIRGNIIKWWQQVLLPVLHINNNERRRGYSFWKKEQTNDLGEESEDMFLSQAESTEAMEDVSSEGGASEQGDALSVLNRIQQEKEQERQREIEKAKQQAQEKERIASIMSANKVDVNAFIEAGKAAIQDNNEEHTDTVDEDMQKAQDIIERLNREAAEDEAKKQAEIDAAKQMAKETFG